MRSDRLSRFLPFLLPVLVAGLPAALPAHILSLILDGPAARLPDRVSGSLFFGHPFEHQLLDQEPPESVRVLLPGGSSLDLTSKLAREMSRGAEGKEVPTFRFSFEPTERGDFVIAAAARPRFEGDEEGYVKDFVKAVLHVQGERGWERAVGTPLEVLPLTRPYGLRPGSVFLARALLDGKALEGELAEVERYNPRPPAELPEGEFITRTVRTGPGGLIASTLDEPGWWSITVTRRQGTMPRGGKDLPLVLRATFWVWVGDPLLPRG